MMKNEQPVSINEIVMLQAYLEHVVSIENKCKDDFSHTEWYLREKYPKEKVKAIINYFEENGFKCDCDLVKKVD